LQLDKEMAKYREAMKKKTAPAAGPAAEVPVVGKRQKKQQHTLQSDANTIEQSLKDAW